MKANNAENSAEEEKIKLRAMIFSVLYKVDSMGCDPWVNVEVVKEKEKMLPLPVFLLYN